MAYTKYSLTPANNNATPPDGAPEGMLPSAVNDTMRDMMAQIRDVGDGIRDGTYTMTAAKITGGTITGVAFTGNTFTSPVISGGSINNTTIGATTANTGAFTTLSATGNVSFDGGSFVFNEAGADKDARFEGDTDANLLFLDASTDRIGIGTSSPALKLSVVGSILTSGTTNSVYSKYSNTGSDFWVGIDNSTGGDFGTSTAYARAIYSSGAYPLVVSTNDVERMRITSGGDLLVGTTSTSIVSGWTAKGIAMSGDLTGGAMTINSSSSTGTQYFIGFGRGGSLCGSIQSTGTNATSYSTSSDYRLKENIAPMTGALAKIAQLKPVTYTWKSDGTESQGFIAHELQAVVPDCVIGEKDAVDADGNIKPQGVDTSFLVATLTAAIQELNTKVEAQAVRIAELESK